MSADPDLPCPHENFAANVNVGRMLDDGQTIPKAYVAEVKVECADCGEPFRWAGVQAGVSFDRPMCSPDETELRAPLRPASADPDFGLGLPGFAINFRPAAPTAEECADGCVLADEDHDCCAREHGECDGLGCEDCNQGRVWVFR